MFRRTPASSEAHDQPDPIAPSPVVVIDDETFEDQTAGRVTLVDFWAPWCGPCRTFSPIFEEAAHDHGDRIRFGACNVDENPRVSQLLQIMSIPTLVAFDPAGNELGRISGVVPRQGLDQIVEEVMAATGTGTHDG